MAVGIAAAIIFMFYAACIPVELALKIRSDPKPGFGAGIALFEGRFALRRAEKRMDGAKKHLPWKNFYADAEKMQLLPAIKYLLRHLKIERLALSGSIGTGDAAATALICGGAEALRCAAVPFATPGKLALDISPDFSGNRSDLRFSGMVSVPAGHIICAALLCAVYLAKGRIEQWKSTRLKIS